MYNLIVTANPDAFNGDPITLEVGRCVREYTDDALTEKYGNFDEAAINELTSLPTIFACENGCNVEPRFGTIKDITYRKAQHQVRIEYEIIDIDNFLSQDQLNELSFELDIGKWEMTRTHWALKDVNIAKELHNKGIILPDWTRRVGKTVDITKHIFDVGLSFPGEARELVEEVAKGLEQIVGPNSYFYDNNYVAQLARPSLDVLLQDIYRNRSRLVVVFIGSAYQTKDWCGIEWRAIREIIAERREANRIMFVRMDDGDVDGVFKTDGYVDARAFQPAQIAQMISERFALL